MASSQFFTQKEQQSPTKYLSVNTYNIKVLSLFSFFCYYQFRKGSGFLRQRGLVKIKGYSNYSGIVWLGKGVLCEEEK